MPEEQTIEVDALYRQWEQKILWKANEMESKAHDKKCKAACICRKRQEEIHEWEDWFLENYDKPEYERNWRIPVKILSRISEKEPAVS